MIQTFRQLPRGIDDAADVVIIGTGAAGGAAGKVLVDAGLEVVFVEEGPPIDRVRAHKNLAETMRHLFRDGGTQVATGRSVIPVLQGRCIGGSTAINSAICWRVPEDAWGRAFAKPGLADAVPLAELERWYGVIEEDLHVRPTRPEVAGRNNWLMQHGAEKLGWEGRPTRRNEDGCEGSGRCMQTCASQRKRSVEATYIPHAIARGARVYATCRAIGFTTSKGRVTGVRARLWDPDTGAQHAPVTIHARRAVILAASAIQTPILLGTLRVAGSAHVGRHLKAHPGTGVAGYYDEPVLPWLGATQGYEVTHFRKQGVKLESLALGPELGSVRLAGIGEQFTSHLRDFERYAVWVAAVRADCEGRVRGSPTGSAQITLTPTSEDLAKLRVGLRAIAEMHFAAGARWVVPGVHGLPDRLGADQLSLLDTAPLDPRAYSLVATHLFGTARMAREARDGVIGTDFQVFGAPGLYVLDSSLFPNNIGVNPQHTIMAIAMLASERLLAHSS